MLYPNSTPNQLIYRLVLIPAESRCALVQFQGLGYHLPSISIPRRTRPAQELQKAIRIRWGLSSVILDFLPSAENSPLCAVVQILSRCRSDALTGMSLGEIPESELSEQQRAIIEQIFTDEPGTRGPFSRISWIHEAQEWLRLETGKPLSSTEEMRQYNAGGRFALIRFAMADGSAYWLKATGAPNIHELTVTKALTVLCPDYLPPLVSFRRDWNAWLMEEAGEPIGANSTLSELEHAVVAMAELQKKTIGHTEELLSAGVMDWRSVLGKHSAEMLDYLEEAMAQQVTTKVPQLEHHRLSEIGNILREVSLRMEELGISDTVIHGDMNHGNILFDGYHCRFVDWCEAYIANPFIAFQYLALLNDNEQSTLRDLRAREAYKRSWLGLLDPAQIDLAFALAPLLAAIFYLYGRGDWLRSSCRNDPNRQRYARSLGRHIDRAARAPELLEVLCH